MTATTVFTYIVYFVLMTLSYICEGLAIAIKYLCDNVPGWVNTFKSDMKEVKELVLEEVDAAMLYFKEIMDGEEGEYLQQVQMEKR